MHLNKGDFDSCRHMIAAGITDLCPKGCTQGDVTGGCIINVFVANQLRHWQTITYLSY